MLRPFDVIERTGAGQRIDLVRILLGYPREVFASAVTPVLEGFADFVQLLPAMESPYHRECGGRFIHSLEIVLRALHHRRGQVLPRGAPPEVIGLHAHRWTYAVFVAALLSPLPRLTLASRVVLRGHGHDLEVWDPIQGGMSVIGATAYRIEVLDDNCLTDSLAGLPTRLYGVWVPESVRDWLDQAPGLTEELDCCLAGRTVKHHGAIAAMVRRAMGASFSGEGVPVAGDCGRAPPAFDGHPPHGDSEALLAVGASERGAPMPRVSGASASDAIGTGQALDIAQDFMRWIKSGIARGAIRVNDTDALVHRVPEGILLVSPRIFRDYAKRLRREGGAVLTELPSDPGDAAKWVQRQVLRADWHLRADTGANIIDYQFRDGPRKGARLSGVVIRDPGQLLDQVPVISDMLVCASALEGGS